MHKKNLRLLTGQKNLKLNSGLNFTRLKFLNELMESNPFGSLMIACEELQEPRMVCLQNLLVGSQLVLEVEWKEKTS